LLNHPGPLLVPAPVVVEVCQLLASRQGADAEAAFLRTLGTDALTVIDLEPADYTRAAHLVAPAEGTNRAPAGERTETN
jgi:hypothetical protein